MKFHEETQVHSRQVLMEGKQTWDASGSSEIAPGFVQLKDVWPSYFCELTATKQNKLNIFPQTNMLLINTQFCLSTIMPFCNQHSENTDLEISTFLRSSFRGVPQGTFHGPVLFSVFTPCNDILISIIVVRLLIDHYTASLM